MDPLIIVSSDSHATVPVELWPEYFDKRFHQHLPQMQYESDLYTSSVWPMSKMVLSRPDILEDHTTGGWRGVYDLDVRLAQMDREGIAAELVYHGDARCGELGCNVTNSVWPFDVWDAGARAYNRWASDTFGSATDRLLLTAAIGSCSDIDATVAELRWIADNGFVATFVPGFLRHPDLPPLFDPYWEPVWDACEELGITLVVHAGFGFEQGLLYDSMEQAHREIKESNGSEMDLIMKLATEVFTGEFFSDTRARRPMWQLMFGGVFDRHPNLKLVMTEVRLDWIPSTLAHLDALYDQHRADVPALKKPSEYWRESCIAGASFVHKVEIEMRHEIGVDTILFGRDYPHPEGTWPNTPDWIRDAFAGVPEGELRKMLGENAIPFFGLDKARLAAIAEKIGPTVQEVAGPNEPVDPEFIALFDGRGGYLKEAEGDKRIPEIQPLIEADLERFAPTSV
ncbi:MAG TPA: amidohydrolase family protein [Acidimicrobiales bacterium]